MTKRSYYGTIKKLNWTEPKFYEKVKKSTNEDFYSRVDYVPGSPIITGSHTALKPAIKINKGPDLYIGKAVRTPVVYGPGGPQFQRKRDESGKFAPSESAGEESTAGDDVAEQKREDVLRQKRLKERLHGRGYGGKHLIDTEKAMIPGSSGADLLSKDSNEMNGQPIGQTQSGRPIYDDPFSSGHKDFSPQEHQEASDLHQQMAEQAQTSGDLSGAAKHQSDSQAHMQQISGSMTPGGRFIDNLFNKQGPPEIQPNDSRQLSNLLGSSNENRDQSNPLIAGNSNQFTSSKDGLANFLGQGGNAVDQNKPDLSNEAQGPKPGMVNTFTGGPVGPQTNMRGFGQPGNGLPAPRGPEAHPKGAMASPMPKPSSQESQGVEGLFSQKPEPSAGLRDMPPSTQNDMESPGQYMKQDMVKEKNAIPESNAGFPGPDASYNSEEDKKKEVTMKALKALSRYA